MRRRRRSFHGLALLRRTRSRACATEPLPARTMTQRKREREKESSSLIESNLRRRFSFESNSTFVSEINFHFGAAAADEDDSNVRATCKLIDTTQSARLARLRRAASPEMRHSQRIGYLASERGAICIIGSLRSLARQP